MATNNTHQTTELEQPQRQNVILTWSCVPMHRAVSFYMDYNDQVGESLSRHALGSPRRAAITLVNLVIRATLLTMSAAISMLPLIVSSSICGLRGISKSGPANKKRRNGGLVAFFFFFFI